MLVQGEVEGVGRGLEPGPAWVCVEVGLHPWEDAAELSVWAELVQRGKQGREMAAEPLFLLCVD